MASHSHHWCDGWHCFGNVASADGFSVLAPLKGWRSAFKESSCSEWYKIQEQWFLLDFQNTHFNFNTLTNLNPRKRPLTHRHLPNHGGPCEKCAGFAFHHSFHPVFTFIKRRGSQGRHRGNIGVLWPSSSFWLSGVATSKPRSFKAWKEWYQIGMFEERNTWSPKKSVLPRDDFAPVSFHFQFHMHMFLSRLNRSTCTALKHISVRVQFETPLLNEMWVSTQAKRQGGWESKLGVPTTNKCLEINASSVLPSMSWDSLESLGRWTSLPSALQQLTYK